MQTTIQTLFKRGYSKARISAGVLDANFYEPVVQRTYSAFAAHYGFWPQPCRVYRPTDKGYVKSFIM